MFEMHTISIFGKRAIVLHVIEFYFFYEWFVNEIEIIVFEDCFL